MANLYIKIMHFTHIYTSIQVPAKQTDGVPCGLRACKNTACSVSWPEVIKGVSNHGLDYLLARTVFSFLCSVSGVYDVLFPCFWLSVSVQ